MDQFHFFQCMGKFLKRCCKTAGFLSSLKKTWYLKIKLGLNQGTPALTSLYKLSMTSINPLMMDGKYQMFSLTYQKGMTKFDIKM